MKKLNCYLFYICGTNIPCSECEEINIEIPVMSLEGDADVVAVSVTENINKNTIIRTGTPLVSINMIKLTYMHDTVWVVTDRISI